MFGGKLLGVAAAQHHTINSPLTSVRAARALQAAAALNSLSRSQQAGPAGQSRSRNADESTPRLPPCCLPPPLLCRAVVAICAQVGGGW